MSDFFDGFDIPNTTPVPDVVFDELLEKLTGNELKVLFYIIRRTYGFGKNADAISLSQFREGIKTQEGKVLDKGCGIKHNRTILAALNSLEEIGCVVSRKRNTKAGDSDTTIYSMRFKKSSKASSEASSPKEVVTSGNHVVTPGNEGSYSTSPRWLPQVTTVVTSGNQQETVLQYTELQETDKQEESIPDQSQNATISPNGDSLSQENVLLQEQLAKRDEQIAQLLEKVTQLSTRISELSTLVEKPNNQTGTEANDETSYSQPATQQSLLPGEPPTIEEKPKVPVMPPSTVKWCPETAIQVVEAKLKKYYRPAARDKQLGFAKRMFREDPELTREQFEAAYDKRNDQWWHDHKGVLHLNHMVEKDRIHEMLDKIDVEKEKKASPGSNNTRNQSTNIRQLPITPPTERPSVLVSQSARERNIARLLAKCEEEDQALALAK